MEKSRPLTALLFDKKHLADILSGCKYTTIREGKRDYQLGDKVILCCPWANWCIMAYVSTVYTCKLEDVYENDLYNCGYEDLGDAQKELQEYYLDLTLQDEVTVITWIQLEGILV